MKKLTLILLSFIFAFVIYLKEGNTITIHHGRIEFLDDKVIVYDGNPEKIRAIINADSVKYIWRE